MKTQCPGCLRGLPVHNGIHCGELEYIKCTRIRLELVPKERDTWHLDKKRKIVDLPFVCGGER